MNKNTEEKIVIVTGATEAGETGGKSSCVQL
jgi:hypothetical protein